MDAVSNVPLVPSDTPASDAHAVYFNADAGTAYAFDPRDGRCLWSTRTKGISITGALNVQRINVTFSYCSPLLDHDKLLVADGLGNIYALRVSDGAVLWQAHPGYTYRFVLRHRLLYIATDQGFFQLDATTGKTLRQHLVPRGIIRCEIQNDVAILTHAIFPNVIGGWELFDLKHWKTISRDPNFACRYGISITGNMLLLSGYDVRDPEIFKPEIRAYRLSLAPSDMPQLDHSREAIH